MFSWISLAVAAQLINAGVALVDKYIVTNEKAVPKPFVYAFYTCILSGAWVAVFLVGLVPIPGLLGLGIPSFHNIKAPDISVVAFSLLAAYVFFIALISMYSALKEADASDVVPVVGAVSGISSFVGSFLFLGADLTPNFLIGLALLCAGTFLVSHFRFTWRIAMTSIHSGIFFGLHYVLLKSVFNETSFDNGFFWSRMAFFIVALTTLLVPGYLERIGGQTKKTTKKSGFLVLGNKFMAGIGTILILKATALGNVAIVQALGGLQFVFILIFTMFIGNKARVTCGESLTCSEDIYHKATFIAVITLGFFVLFV